MLELVLLLFAVFELVRMIRLRGVGHDRFPHVSAEAFYEWKNAQSKAHLAFVMVFPCEIATAVVLMFVLLPLQRGGGNMGTFFLVYFVQFFAWLTFAAIMGSKAKRLARKENIVWP